MRHEYNTSFDRYDTDICLGIIINGKSQIFKKCTITHLVCQVSANKWKLSSLLQIPIWYHSTSDKVKETQCIGHFENFQKLNIWTPTAWDGSPGRGEGTMAARSKALSIAKTNSPSPIPSWTCPFSAILFFILGLLWKMSGTHLDTSQDQDMS